MSEPTRIRADLFAVYHDGHPRAGKTIARQATCECGATFTQFCLSERFLAACEALNGGGPLRAVQAQIPEGFVPVFCPSCERKDVARQQRLAHVRANDGLETQQTMRARLREAEPRDYQLAASGDA